MCKTFHLLITVTVRTAQIMKLERNERESKHTNKHAKKEIQVTIIVMSRI